MLTPSRLYKTMIAALALVGVFANAAIRAEEAPAANAPPIAGWLQWRGPSQNGLSAEVDLPERIDPRPGGENFLWRLDLPGRGSPVIARYGEQERIFIWGYRGQTIDLREVLLCADAKTGEEIWRREFSDFISDTIYNRYAIGSPSVDDQTGNVYLMTTPGLLMGFDRDGNLLWRHSMMEQYGRLTFPNGRTGAPTIDGDRVVVNAITTNWGAEGPGRNRFYAFDKKTGGLIWSSTPGVGPPFLKDSSFCTPVFETRAGMRVFYAGTGCGNIVAVNAGTGQPLFRYQMAMGGINSQPIILGDTLIAVHGKENVDDTGRGRMIALDLRKAWTAVTEQLEKPDAQWPVVLDKSDELWRNDAISMFTSSPVALNDRVYQVTTAGELFCVDAATGETIWHQKIGADQLHASPLAADGKIYLPTWHDGFYILKPNDDGPNILQQVALDGECIGSPSLYNGKLYVQTKRAVYCFGQHRETNFAWRKPHTPKGMNQPVTKRSLQIVPCEVLLRPGDLKPFHIDMVNAYGNAIHNGHSYTLAGDGGYWRRFIPPAAKVNAELDAHIDLQGRLFAPAAANRSAGAFEATVPINRPDGKKLEAKGTFRGRVLPSPPYTEDFESFELHEADASGAKFAYPPLPWIGARVKWVVRDIDGSKALTKTLSNVLFQRSMVFVGHPDDANYTIQADVMTDGNRRVRGDVGLINQRYIISLRGNNRILEIHSNHERFKHSVAYDVKPNTWYRLKTRVDVDDHGAGVVRAKVWPRDQAEPTDWTLEADHDHAHQQGSPGLFGFSPQSLFSVYIDNIKVTPNK